MNKNTKIATIDPSIKDILAKGIDNTKLKEKVEEYIEICKLKEKLALEIHKITQEESKTKDYITELEIDLKAVAKKDKTKNSK